MSKHDFTKATIVKAAVMVGLVSIAPGPAAAFGFHGGRSGGFTRPIQSGGGFTFNRGAIPAARRGNVTGLNAAVKFHYCGPGTYWNGVACWGHRRSPPHPRR